MPHDDNQIVVLEILAKEFDVPIDKLDPSISLISDLGADSLSLINIMMQVEEALNIELPESEWRSLKTVGDVLSRLRTVPSLALAEAVAQP